MSPFWQLPEPARFVRNVVDDLRTGYNVVLAIPDYAPAGWPSALRAGLAAVSLPAMDGIQPNGIAPITTIHQALTLGDCAPETTPADLCDQPGFRGRIINVEPFTSAAWPAWSDFLAKYEDVCRHKTRADRTLFVVTLSGELAASAPAPAALLRIHPWQDRMDGLNTRLHAANLLTSSGLPPWQRQLAVAVLAELALWDPEVVTAGASLPLADILTPEAWLTEIAISRGWKSDVPRQPAAQWRGIQQKFEGRYRTHSAWLALAGRKDAIANRIWTAQVAALFPLLERHRRALLQCYRKIFKFPWPTKYADITTLQDLELNHIADQLWVQNSRGLRDVAKFVGWLRDIRNELAHLNNLAPSLILNPNFQSRMESFATNPED